ncbi:MAG: SLC13 family permease, partial [Lysobacteraceae bacterium]
MRDIAIWAISGLAVLGVIARPWRVAESAWALAGAIALVIFGLLPWHDALLAVGKGVDVCLFLAGMMLLSELARREGLFDFLAAYAVNHARGSASRLFLLTYAIGMLVTIFMSNDATAVLLTPAVYAAARHARANPLPYLFVCAFIANAASFVLPISNPANLVVFGGHMPSLPQWIAQFALPSILAIVATYAVHRFVQRKSLVARINSEIAIPALTRSGAVTGYGIVAFALTLLAASFLGMPLGMPALVAGSSVAAAVLIGKREAPWAMLRGVSWGVLVLVAGLFVLVEGIARTSALNELATLLHASANASPTMTAWIAGIGTALASNVANNLPMGLIAGSVATAAHVDPRIHGAIAIAIDLGPNLS